jgi:fucose permease
MFVVAFALLCLGRVGTYAGLVAATVALGAGLGGLEALASPLIADLHPDDVELHMPLLHAFFPLGIVASSLLAGWGLDAGMPWQALFGVTSIPAALVGAMFLFGRYGTESHEGPKRVALSVPAVLGNVTFWLLGAAMALTAGVEGALTLWTPSFVQDEYGASALVAASGLTCFSAAMAVGRLGAGFATRRVPLHKMMVALSVACALVTVALVLFRNVSVSFVAFGLSGLFIACFWPGILSVATRRIAAGSATLLAMLSVAGIVGYGGLPWSVGALADRFGLRLALGILPVSMGAAALALFAAGRTSAPDNGYARRVAPE